MEKKLKKDFKERQRARLEREGFQNEADIKPEESKLKHGDDYRGKIVHDKERFQDKVHEKTSKLNIENEPVKQPSKRNTNYVKGFKEEKNTGEVKEDTNIENGSFVLEDTSKDLESAIPKSELTRKDRELTPEEEKAELLKKRKRAKKLRSDLKAEEAPIQNEEVYDPLGKDLDNDGIIDRYDNDFRDSDYFESTYDVEDNLHAKEEYRGNASKSHKAQKKLYKRKNYSDKLYTRKKDDVLKDDKTEGVKTGKEAVYERDKKNRLSKEQKKNIKKETVKVSALSGLAKGSETVRDYLSHGSDENQGVETGEKTADASSKLIHGIKNYSDKKKVKKSYDLSKKDYKIRKRKSKLEFREAKEELKKTEKYKRAGAYKQFQKKKQMKASIGKRNKSRFRDRIKEGIIGTLKGSKEAILRKTKGLMIIFIGLIILGTFFINFASTSMTGIVNSASGVLTTTYLSSPNVLSEVNQKFSSLEQELQDEVNSVESNYPGYDEYIFHNTEYIGHNVHELLSYITARCGEVKNVSEVSSVLNEMFQSMYRLEYREEIEIRYRTVTETYTDEEGNEYTETYEEPYEYKKLIVTLHKREMDSIIREVFAAYPDNLTHYEALFLTQGNMAEAFGNTDLILANGGIGGGEEYEASAEVQKKIVDAAYITPSPGAGWCAMWVSQVYQNAGLGYIGGDACDMYRNHTFTSDRSKLKVGMLVAVESSSSGSQAGLTYGHVGIYIGDGKVIDNIGHIRVTTLDNWIATFCQHHPVGFGFPPSVQ